MVKMRGKEAHNWEGHMGTWISTKEKQARFISKSSGTFSNINATSYLRVTSSAAPMDF